MKTKDTIRLLAEILTGIQVAGSMGVGALGSATVPWKELRERLHLWGWHTTEEAETKLRAILSTKKRASPTEEPTDDR